jgi:hypothetical protein
VSRKPPPLSTSERRQVRRDPREGRGILTGARIRHRVPLLLTLAVGLALGQPAHAGVVSAAFRHYVERTHPCLAAIIDVEGKWDTTVDYGGQHGHTSESYGLGQANPGTKMAPFGRDWRTSPWTQLKWMVSYSVGRYGSECAALAYRRSHGSY